MVRPLGPNFGAEVIEAGLGGLPFAWGADGDEIVTDRLTADQIAALDAVIAAHDPTKGTSVKEKLIAYTNVAQWRKAVSGIVFVQIDGVTVPFLTSENAMSLLNGTIIDMMMPDGPTHANWQIGDTALMPIAKDDLIRAGRAVKTYVQGTFDMLPEIFALIADGTITTTGQIDDVFNQYF